MQEQEKDNEILENLKNFFEYFHKIVKPTVEEYMEGHVDERRLYLACIVLYHTKDYKNQCKEFIDKFIENNNDLKNPFTSNDFQIINDICDITKHAKIDRYTNKRLILDKKSITINYTHVGEGLFNVPFGEATFNNAGIFANSKAIQERTGNHSVSLDTSVRRVLIMIDNLIKKLNGAIN